MYEAVFATIGRQVYDLCLSLGKTCPRRSSTQDAHGLQTGWPTSSTEWYRPLHLLGQSVCHSNTPDHPRQYGHAVQASSRGGVEGFLAGFRSLAADHFMHIGLSTTSHVIAVLAIKLLNNSMLRRETLTNAILTLVSLAESREPLETVNEVSVTHTSH